MTTKKSKAPRRVLKAARTSDVTVKVDAGLKKLWTTALSRLKDASAQGARAWDVRYEAIADIVEHNPPLYLAGGMSTEAQFFEREVGESRQAAYRNMRVAKYASPADVERYTPTRIDLAITWVEARNHGPLNGHTPIAFDKLRFAFQQDGKTVTKGLADITASELQQAIAQLKGHHVASKKASPVAQEVDALIKKAGVGGTTFSLTSKAIVLHVPLAGLAKVASALSAFAPPG